MKTIIVTTGFGYFVRNMNIVAKAELPPGMHPLRDGYEYFEVRDKAALEAVTLFVPGPTAEEINEQKIQAKMREIAIDELKLGGQLPADYVDTKNRIKT